MATTPGRSFGEARLFERHARPERGEGPEVLAREAVEEALAHAGEMGAPRRAESLAPGGRDLGEEAARVVLAGHPLDEAAALEAVNERA